jgi:hypothetical protein
MCLAHVAVFVAEARLPNYPASMDVADPIVISPAAKAAG